jgi:hypothetical protein
MIVNEIVEIAIHIMNVIVIQLQDLPISGENSIT